MRPKHLFHTIEKSNIQGLNHDIRDFVLTGCWTLYGDLKIIYYGDKEHNKIYVQTLICTRTWYEWIFRRD